MNVVQFKYKEPYHIRASKKPGKVLDFRGSVTLLVSKYHDQEAEIKDFTLESREIKKKISKKRKHANYIRGIEL